VALEDASNTTPNAEGPIECASTLLSPQPSSESTRPAQEGETTTTLERPKPSTGMAFSTFQQLDIIPPVPAALLASSFIIPPTYDSVVASTPTPPQNGFRQPVLATSSSSSLSPPAPNLPLLSPISLLANHPARNSGPPGLFFVSRGRQTTGIVDGDGRSVIRRPIQWESNPNPDGITEGLRSIDIINRIETLVIDNRKTIVVGIGATHLQAVDVGQVIYSGSPDILYHQSVEITPPEVERRKLRGGDIVNSFRDVTYLAKVGDRLFWSERNNSSFSIHSLVAS